MGGVAYGTCALWSVEIFVKSQNASAQTVEDWLSVPTQQIGLSIHHFCNTFLSRIFHLGYIVFHFLWKKSYLNYSFHFFPRFLLCLGVCSYSQTRVWKLCYFLFFCLQHKRLTQSSNTRCWGIGRVLCLHLSFENTVYNMSASLLTESENSYVAK